MGNVEVKAGGMDNVMISVMSRDRFAMRLDCVVYTKSKNELRLYFSWCDW